tara:strand:- start:8 stop:628 length:621 start_codon:yes stop_codon:yes gene_type:complete
LFVKVPGCIKTEEGDYILHLIEYKDHNIPVNAPINTDRSKFQEEYLYMEDWIVSNSEMEKIGKGIPRYQNCPKPSEDPADFGIRLTSLDANINDPSLPGVGNMFSEFITLEKGVLSIRIEEYASEAEAVASFDLWNNTYNASIQSLIDFEPKNADESIYFFFIENPSSKVIHVRKGKYVLVMWDMTNEGESQKNIEVAELYLQRLN